MRKKLIEVALPLNAINEASSREKSMRHGHPSSLHLWWARRPLAACRAILFAQLVDDPSSYPEKFQTEEEVITERKRLFAIIEDLVKWENSANDAILEAAREEIRKSCGDKIPKVYDPFSGGASIPLEAQRLGLKASGSDLNPVAVTIGKALVELPELFKNLKPMHPAGNERNHYRNAEGIAEDVKFYGELMRDQAFDNVGHLYQKIELPKDLGGGDATVIAWLWTRTVICPNPGCGAEMPLITTFCISAKKGKEAYLLPRIDGKKIAFEIAENFNIQNMDPKKGYKRGTSGIFECAFCHNVTDRDYVADQGIKGKIGRMPTAVVCEGKNGRIYVEPGNIKEVEDTLFPKDEHLQTEFSPNPRDVWCRNFGLTKPVDLFTKRQLEALNAFKDSVEKVKVQVHEDALNAGMFDDNIHLSDGGTGALAYSEAISVYLSFLVGQLANHSSTLCGWNSPNQQIRSTFARQALPMTWDFAEVNLFSNSSGSFASLFTRMIKGFETLATGSKIGSINQLDAQSVVYDADTVISTDPPYYDNIGYSDLSDFFFAWMKPLLRNVYPNLFGLLATPKTEELVAAPYRQGGAKKAEEFFLNGMSAAINRMSKNSSSDFPAAIYYAFKQSEIEREGISSTGWATFVQAIIDAGFSVVGTWPVRTEKPGRMISWGTNALANSVVMVCRIRPESAEVVTRADFIRALKRELPNAISELQNANVSPADMPQSAIGPGMKVFSNYAAVLEPNDENMKVKTALQLINAELDEYLNNLHGDFDADTRFAVTWFEQNGYGKGDYGAANSIATARGISVENVRHAGIIESSAGKVRVLTRVELDPDWDPASDTHLTIWECCQHLVKEYEENGEIAAAMLIKKMGFDNAETVKDLAYYLYDVCSNKRQDAREATAYNGLIAVWSDLTRLASTIQDTDNNRQVAMDL